MELVERALAAYPGPPPGLPSPEYGTAGFRAEASLLPSTLLRCGVLAAARARAAGQATGVMVTASHNPAADNGVKLVDPSGEMLGAEWEALAEELARAPGAAAAAAVVRRVLDAHPPRPPAGGRGLCPRVIVGRDTRPSGAGLAEAARAGAEALGVPVLDVGLVTTPELHFAVAAANACPVPLHVAPPPPPSPALRSEDGGGAGAAAAAAAAAAEATARGEHEAMEAPYFTRLAESYRILTAGAPPLHFSCPLAAAAAGAGAGGASAGAAPLFPSPPSSSSSASTSTGFPLYVDCANGVGGLKLRDLAPRLRELGLDLRLANDGASPSPEAAAARLNLRCGADHVQKERALPDGMGLLLVPPLVPPAGPAGDGDALDGVVRVPPGALCASLDGDADRVVFFYVDPSAAAAAVAGGGGADGGAASGADKGPPPVVLLDGDRIAALCARYLVELLAAVAAAGGLAAGGGEIGDAGGGAAAADAAPASSAAAASSAAPRPTVGVVQTAYANGASTAYLRDVLGLPVACAPTGVKHLHREAQRRFDAGVYFEANGHGTALLAPALREALVDRRLDDCLAVVQLLAVARVMNQHVGDAVGGLLLVDAVLRRRAQALARAAAAAAAEANGGGGGGRGGGPAAEAAASAAAAGAVPSAAAAPLLPAPAVAEWAALYADLPSRQLKVKVADRSAVATADAERVCTAPPGLRQAIEAAVAARGGGGGGNGGGGGGGGGARAFARPSGTEDAVRVYAEAGTQEDADALALDALRAVYDLAGGVGPRP